jgi:hypothetical protein
MSKRMTAEYHRVRIGPKVISDGDRTAISPGAASVLLKMLRAATPAQPAVHDHCPPAA